METPGRRLLLLLTLLISSSCAAAGNADILYAQLGTSVTLPGEVVDNYTLQEYKKHDGSLIMTRYGDYQVLEPYTRRGRYHPANGTFLLTNLTKADSGTYVHEINMTVTRQIHLQVIAPVETPNLMTHVTTVMVILECQAQGGGPFIITFTKDNAEFRKNMNMSESSASLYWDLWDPMSAGRYTCKVKNPVSEASTDTELLRVATQAQSMMAYIASGLLLPCGMCILREFLCTRNWMQKCKRKKQHHQPNQDEEDKKPGIIMRALRCTARIYVTVLGLLTESAAIYISLHGGFFPHWWWLVPAFLLLCRTILHITQCAKTLGRKAADAGYGGCISGKSTLFSVGKKILLFMKKVRIVSVIGAPVFYGVVLYIYIAYFYHPGGQKDIWRSLLACLVVVGLFVGLFAISCLWMATEARKYLPKYLCCQDESQNPQLGENKMKLMSSVQENPIKHPGEAGEHGTSCVIPIDEPLEENISNPEELQSQGPRRAALAQRREHMATDEHAVARVTMKGVNS